MHEIRIAISPETLALLEMSMTEGDTYDEVIRRLVKGADFTITFPEGISIDPGRITEMKVIDRVADETRIRLADLAKAARAVRDDIARTVDLEALREIRDAKRGEVKRGLVVKDAISVIMNTDKALALDSAVKAVFDE